MRRRVSTRLSAMLVVLTGGDETESQRRLVIAATLSTQLQLVGLMIDGAVIPDTGLSSILIDTSGGLMPAEPTRIPTAGPLGWICACAAHIH